jgi:hypothetical protein
VNGILQASVLLDLLEQVAKLRSNLQPHLSSPLQESECRVLFPEECLGIQVVIRLDRRILLF